MDNNETSVSETRNPQTNNNDRKFNVFWTLNKSLLMSAFYTKQNKKMKTGKFVIQETYIYLILQTNK